jgi:hypothetical protein
VFFVTIPKRCRRILRLLVLAVDWSGRERTEGEGTDGPHTALAASSRGVPSDPATVTEHEAARRLHGRRLLAARAAWLVVVALTLGLAIPGFVVGFDRPELLHQPEVRALVERLGLPNRAVMAAGLLVPMAAVTAIAIFLFWRRSDDWMAMLFSLAMITSIAFTTRSLSALEQAYPAVRVPVQLIWLLAFVLIIVTLYLFPDGRFVPDPLACSPSLQSCSSCFRPSCLRAC